MRRFVLERTVDHSGVSGTGTVVNGVAFPNGQVVMQWRGPYPSLVVWPDLDMAMTVHGHGDDTRVRWIDPE
ncbi:hypothetical protein ACIQXD_29730 [Streptomyces uncialis]|uniref:hypothetical protein n=1 Tax=Streptomyces uncialis TaxID=1048205 RepID=UPI003807F3E1